MNDDPFEQFEQSRGGLLIPVLLFILGAVPTTLALRAMNPLAVFESPAEVEGDMVEGDIDEQAMEDATMERPGFLPQEPSVQ